jgi:aminoglycoside 6-adenylyltransferase
LKRWLQPDLWTELEETYTGADIYSNWTALIRIIDLMRRLAIEVGERLGFSYPEQLERRVVAYLHRVKEFPAHRPAD